MRVTKEQARNTLCHQTLGGANGGAGPCCATECMAWRWWDDPLPEEQHYRNSGGYFRLGHPDVGNTIEDARIKMKRPDNVPAHWPLEEDEGHVAFMEPEAEFEARKAKLIADYPEKIRRGYCGLAGRAMVG
jgi:hypothetical protein